LIVKVQENPIIQSIEITGVKNKTVLELLKDNLSLKEKNPFVENKVRRDEIKLKNILKINGYYFSKIKSKVKNNLNNTIDLKYEIDLGEKAYISSIKFIGDPEQRIKEDYLRILRYFRFYLNYSNYEHEIEISIISDFPAIDHFLEKLSNILMFE